MPLPESALVCGPKNAPMFAIKAGGKGVLGEDAVVWKSPRREVTSDVPTPLFYRQRLFILNGNRKEIFCLNPTTGAVLWSGELESRTVFETSPTGADGKLYFMNHEGEVFVVDALADDFKFLHKAAMGGEGEKQARSSVVAAQDRLFIRTAGVLFCVGASR